MPVSPAVANAFAMTFAFLFGANVGSFLNVVVHRVPLDLSIVRPRSRCPLCRTRVRAIDNIPMLSWLGLGGRCRGCKTRISWRYTAVELGTALIAVHVAYALAIAPTPVGALAGARTWLLAAVVFSAAAAWLAAALIDADHRILPDEITIYGMWAAPAVCAFFPELVLGSARTVPSWFPSGLPLPLAAAAFSAAGIAAGAGIVYAIGHVGKLVFRKEAMGFGDVKFLGMIGGFVGPVGALLVLVVGAVATTVVAPLRMLFTRDRYIPFGPFLALGGYVVILYGPAMVEWYLARIGLGAGG